MSVARHHAAARPTGRAVTGVLVEAPASGGVVQAPASPLSAAQLATDGSETGGAAGGSVGWLGVGLLLVLLVAGVLVELDVPLPRRGPAATR